MKAIVCNRYGTEDVLKLEEVDKPTPKDSEVLIKVHAASINSWDFEMLLGRPYILRLQKLTRPAYRILGADVAGTVEVIGGEVTKFKLGDEVFGDLSESGWGGLGEFTCAHEDAVVLKPDSLTFEEAAAIPQAGVMALQGIRDHGDVQRGQKVLINGGGGGVGTFAIQIAKSYGAEVTGVDNAGKLELMRSIRADHVIDYKKEDFTKNGVQYDFILDCQVHRSIRASKRALKSGGKYSMIGGSLTRMLLAIVVGPLVSFTKKKKMRIMVLSANKNLADLIELFEDGKVGCVIDRTYPLEETAKAFKRIREGKSKGKLVITIDDNEPDEAE